MPLIPAFQRILSAFMLTVLVGLPLQTAAAGKFDHGVLWEISKPGIHRSFVFGTIHSDDPRVTQLPQAVERAFDASRSFTGELDLSAESRAKMEQDLLLPPGKTLEPLVGASRYRKCVALMAEYGVPENIVRRMRPWAIALQLNMPRPGKDRFLDLVLYQRAVQRGLPVYGLESIQEQIAVFDTLSAGQQLELLDQAIASYDSTPALIQTLIDLYLARDLAGLQAVNKHELQIGDTRLAEDIEQRLILTRNHRMVARMQDRLREGRAFIAVGALHLPGKQGILMLLQEQGYLVRYVY